MNDCEVNGVTYLCTSWITESGFGTGEDEMRDGKRRRERSERRESGIVMVLVSAGWKRQREREREQTSVGL